MRSARFVDSASQNQQAGVLAVRHVRQRIAKSVCLVVQIVGGWHDDENSVGTRWCSWGCSFVKQAHLSQVGSLNSPPTSRAQALTHAYSYVTNHLTVRTRRALRPKIPARGVCLGAMSHTVTRNSFRASWALGLGLTASTLLGGTAAAEPATTTDASSPAVGVPAIRDQWYLDPAAPQIAPVILAQTRDSWYLDDFARSSPPARSHRSQEEA